MDKAMLAMSGGVDSSVSLLRLKDNFDLAGVTLKLYETGCSSSSIEDARVVADKFDIPHYTFDLSDEFRNKVIEKFISSYINGETPNPCVDCNKHIKFAALMLHAEQLGYKYIATGHYARAQYCEKKGRWLLKKAVCNGKVNPKDQSYVLYNLTQEQLSRALFPIGELSKQQVRDIAQEHDLINSTKPDSQDICFIPNGNYNRFIRSYKGCEFACGNITDKDGNILGTHNGIIDYTIGQRRGLRLSMNVPMYVTGKNADDNTVIIGPKEDLMRQSLIADNLNWIAIDELTEPIHVTAKTRYNSKEQDCKVEPIGGGKVKVSFTLPQSAITPGQRVVFYDDDMVVGGGVIL